MHGPYEYDWISGSGMLFGGLWMLLMWGIPLLVVFALLKYLFAKSRNNGVQENRPEKTSAIDILKETYARGEISREEYLLKRDDLLEK